MNKSALSSVLALVLLLSQDTLAQVTYYSPLMSQQLTLAPSVLPVTGYPQVAPISSVGGIQPNMYGVAQPNSYGYQQAMLQRPSPYWVALRQQAYQQRIQQQQRNQQMIVLGGMAAGMLLVNMFKGGFGGLGGGSSYSPSSSYAPSSDSGSYSPASNSSPSVAYQPRSTASAASTASTASVDPDIAPAARTPAASTGSSRPIAKPIAQQNDDAPVTTKPSGTAKPASASPPDQSVAKPAAAEPAKAPDTSANLFTREVCMKTSKGSSEAQRVLAAQVRKIASCQKGNRGTIFSLQTINDHYVMKVQDLSRDAWSAALAEGKRKHPFADSIGQVTMARVEDGVRAIDFETQICRKGDVITANMVGQSPDGPVNGYLTINMTSNGRFSAKGMIDGKVPVATEAFGVK